LIENSRRRSLIYGTKLNPLNINCQRLKHQKLQGGDIWSTNLTPTKQTAGKTYTSALDTAMKTTTATTTVTSSSDFFLLNKKDKPTLPSLSKTNKQHWLVKIISGNLNKRKQFTDFTGNTNIVCLQEAQGLKEYPLNFLLKSPNNGLIIASQGKMTPLKNTNRVQLALIQTGGTSLFMFNIHLLNFKNKLLNIIAKDIHKIITVCPSANIVCIGDFNLERPIVPGIELKNPPTFTFFRGDNVKSMIDHLYGIFAYRTA
jgi:hypothetical protein